MSGVFNPALLQGKNALVTGGATGLGFEIARTLGGHGARIALLSRQPEHLESACHTLRDEGIDCCWAVADIRDPGQISIALETLGESITGFDILVNNAAGNFPAPLESLSSNGFSTVVDIDLNGTFNATRALFEHSLRQRGGQIVNISAAFQNLGVAFQAHAAAAKAGVDSLTRTCAVEYAPHGIRVNAVAPGAIAATEGFKRTTMLGDAATLCPLGYAADKREIAQVVLFLVSDAASYITGQILVADGGAAIDMLKLRT